VGRLKDNDKVLLCVGSQLDSDSLGRLPAVGIFNPPAFRFGFTVDYEISAPFFKKWKRKFKILKLTFQALTIIVENFAVDGQLYNLLSFSQIAHR
jgi:hypothetical protein